MLPGFSVGRLPNTVERSPVLHLSSIPVSPQGLAQVAQGQSPLNIGRPGMAQAALVYHSPRAVSGHSNSTSVVAGPDHSGTRMTLPSRTAIPPPHSVDAAWLTQSELRCSRSVQQVLLGSRKPSTRSTYLAKWKCFSCWCALGDTAPLQASVPTILDYRVLETAGPSSFIHQSTPSRDFSFPPGRKWALGLLQSHGQQVPHGIGMPVPANSSSGPYVGPQPGHIQTHGCPVRADSHLLAAIPFLEDSLPHSYHLGEACV
ncbi:hypothetical protein G0U57_014495 [Chelydra serpentina]|uniref:Uncharacterized protein n=1 Tax=Chelydra serpentina TaxID=8475 RepID=A0A8T1S9S5_CHESE|nr:hypothetical protein G0U57_014495 [Chelydra serpentina]